MAFLVSKRGYTEAQNPKIRGWCESLAFSAQILQNMSRKGSYLRVLHSWRQSATPKTVSLEHLKILIPELQAIILDSSVGGEPACLPAVLVPKAKGSFRESVTGRRKRC